MKKKLKTISRKDIWKIAKLRYPIISPEHKDYEIVCALRVAFIKGMKMRDHLELKNVSHGK